MEEETLHQRYLVVIALILCALIIGYNAFYVPDASLSALTVLTDVSSAVPSSGAAAAASSSAVSGDEAYTPAAPDSSSAAASRPVPASSSAKPAVGKININMATAQQLSDGLDGIGAVMAQRIVDYRGQHGNFKSIEEIKNVSGIGDKTFEKIQNSITVG
jgi:competence protein ComEA helix-hairpin-helix repeat region